MYLAKTKQKSLQEIVAHEMNVGVEVEKLRIEPTGQLSRKAFPTSLSKQVQPFIGREYFSAQMEFTFPPMTNAHANILQIQQVIADVATQLSPDERLWDYSCPPALPEQLPLSVISPEPCALLPYRQKLGRLYGMHRLMNNGVHLNLSFSDDAVTAILAQTDLPDHDALYVHIAQQFMVHRWVFTYLFGATPLTYAGYLRTHTLDHPVRSLRSSSLGFPANIHGDYRSVEHYVARIQQAIADGELERPNQYYEPVRLKSPSGKDPRQLLTDGLSHVELRAFDLNPLTIAGVTIDELRFIQAFTLYLALQKPFTDEELEAELTAKRALNEQIALEDPRRPSRCQPQGVALLTALADFAERQQFGPAYLNSIEHFLKIFSDHRETLANQVLKNLLKTPRYVAR